MSTTIGLAARPAPARPKRRRRLSFTGAVGLLILLVMIGGALAARWISPYDPTLVDITARLKPPAWLAAGSTKHLLGTDQLGRDLLSRIIFGARSSLIVAGFATLISSLIGGAVGIVAAYFKGSVDQIISRILDIQLAFPSLLLAITIMAVAKPSVTMVIIVLSITGWVVPCRIVRSRALAVTEQEFVAGAAAVGAAHSRILVRHLLPNVLPTLITIATLQGAHFVLAEASLSFLGLGLPPAIPSWGGIMNQGRDYIELAWWIETFPGLAIMLLISALGLLGDWVRDVMDPRMRT